MSDSHLSFAQLCREEAEDRKSRPTIDSHEQVALKAAAFEALAGLLERAEKWRAIPAIRLEQELGEIVDSIAAGFRGA